MIYYDDALLCVFHLTLHIVLILIILGQFLNIFLFSGCNSYLPPRTGQDLLGYVSNLLSARGA